MYRERVAGNYDEESMFWLSMSQGITKLPDFMDFSKEPIAPTPFSVPVVK